MVIVRSSAATACGGAFVGSLERHVHPIIHVHAIQDHINKEGDEPGTRDEATVVGVGDMGSRDIHIVTVVYSVPSTKVLFAKFRLDLYCGAPGLSSRAAPRVDIQCPECLL